MQDLTPRRPRPAQSDTDVEALWPRAVQGDRDAAERLAASTYQMVFASLVKLSGDPDTAADLTQETYRKAWAALPKFRGGSAFRSWLYRIAYTTFLNHIRRPARVVPLTERQELELSDPEPSPLDRAGRGQEDQALRRAVLALPEKLSYTVSARYWAEVPVKEIAGQQGITTVAVRKRLKKALSLLATTLEDVQ